MQPPSYELAPPPAAAAAVLLNIIPKQPLIDFQTGYLGATRSTLAGDVQTKLVAGGNTATFRKLELFFHGVERVDSGAFASEVELVSQHTMLWSADEPSTSDAAPNGLPANLPFEVELTPDLPHCVHAPHSSLEYRLTAQVTPFDTTSFPITHTIPIHLTRYLPISDRLYAHAENQEAPERCTTSPTTISLSHPVMAHISLGRTIYRRSEPIEIRIRIPPPSAELVQEKGVSLRSVAAELVRVIHYHPLRESSSKAATPDAESSRFPPFRTVLSRSGKGSRFSSSRDVFLRLWLQPAAPLDTLPACETITQSTIMHDVEFRIIVSFTLSGREGDRESIASERRIFLLPDHQPSSLSIRSEKQRTAVLDGEPETALDMSQPPAPVYTSRTYAKTDGPSTSTPIRTALDSTPGWWDGENEEEYDGYEHVSAGAELRPAPPTIDEDSPPPLIEESDGVSSHDTDQPTLPLTPPSVDEDGPPPPPMDGVPPPEYAGEAPASGNQAGPPAYSASTRADEVEVLTTGGRRRMHGVI